MQYITKNKLRMILLKLINKKNLKFKKIKSLKKKDYVVVFSFEFLIVFYFMLDLLNFTD